MAVSLYKLLSDIVKVDDVLFVVKSDGGATSEIRSNSLDIRKSGKWITIGSNDGPAHMHVNYMQIPYAKFVQKQKPDRISYSVIFYDDNERRVFAAFFTKMYDESGHIIPWRKKTYEELHQKYGSTRIELEKMPAQDGRD